MCWALSATLQNHPSSQVVAGQLCAPGRQDNKVGAHLCCITNIHTQLSSAPIWLISITTKPQNMLYSQIRGLCPEVHLEWLREQLFLFISILRDRNQSGHSLASTLGSLEYFSP